MVDVDDGYATYYAERLWQSLPSVYRGADSDSNASDGPLRELLNRIGAQVAVVRRSIDELWEDQSIENCDDWVIPYLGDLLATNLVNGLDARGQRLDVAKTIHYRRRKGTVALLEELATDITGWGVHVVEGFRRLARTRHGLDPAVGPGGYPRTGQADVPALLRDEQLLGRLTSTPAGGFADLRSAHGGLLAHQPFDEFFHSFDARRGQGAVGHFGISKVLVFLWRLVSYPVVGSTPVAVDGCAGQYVFDPTGREVPLFWPAPPTRDSADTWTAAREWQLPGPITSSMETAIDDPGTSPPPRPAYPDSGLPARYGVSGANVSTLWPELGRFTAIDGTPSAVDYHYGFAASLGAGPYDRGLLPDRAATVDPEAFVSGGAGLDAALAALPPTGTLTIQDSLTYPAMHDVGTTAAPIENVLIRADAQRRPVVRPPGRPSWVFTGGGESVLVLDGLLVSGCDIVLRGGFETVRLTACTFDPGSAGSTAALAEAVDGTPLAPTTVWIEADAGAAGGSLGGIRELVVDHCITGPIRTRLGGAVESVTISDSILQAIATTAGAAFTADDVYDPLMLVRGLRTDDPVATRLWQALPATAQQAVVDYAGAAPADRPASLPTAIVDGLNGVVSGPGQYDPAAYATVALSPATLALAAQQSSLDAPALAVLNRALLAETFPLGLELAALAVADATVVADRVTVLGRITAQRLHLSDSIVTGFAAIDDTQDGCVRFSAVSVGSRVPRQDLSVDIAPDAPLFTSTDYGRPGYAQLLEFAESASPGSSIAAGADNGSEMGAFNNLLNPIKERGLLLKYAEYLPLGLTPVLVYVT